MLPLVSILIPAYNSEKWIGNTIQSALNQTWPRKEVIIVDDGSTDGTMEIIQEYESKILKAIRQKNMGGPAARNRALSKAQGDFIQWLDHDDILHKDKIMKQLKSGEYNRDSRILLSSSFGTFYHKIEKAKYRPNALWKDLDPIEFFITKYNTNSWMQSSVWLVSRALTEVAGPWLEIKSIDDDGEYFGRVIMASDKIKFIKEALTYWRVGNYGSMSENRSKESLNAFLYTLKKSMNLLLSIEDTERTRKACLKYLQTWAFVFWDDMEIVEKAKIFAKGLGGILHEPELKWKYRPIRKIFGYNIARRASIVMPRIKTIVKRKFDEWIK